MFSIRSLALYLSLYSLRKELMFIIGRKCYFVIEISMKEMNFILSPEDEMDFIPIIPLNENEGDDSTETDISHLNCLCYHSEIPSYFPVLFCRLPLDGIKVSKQ